MEINYIPIIEYPNKSNEFEIQAELYSLLKSYSINVRGEVVDKNIRNALGNKVGFKKSRFDLVVFDKNNIAKIIIEVKPCITRKKEGTKQFNKYSIYNLHLLYCFRDTNKLILLNRIIDLLDNK